MVDKYIFLVIFELGENGGYCVYFFDLFGCIIEGKIFEEVLYMVKDVLELYLYGLEEDNEEIFEFILFEKLDVFKGVFVVLIVVYMLFVREEMVNKSVNKIVILLWWLNKVVEEVYINFF